MLTRTTRKACAQESRSHLKFFLNPNLMSHFVHKHPQFGLSRDPKSSKSFQEPQGNWRPHRPLRPTDIAANVRDEAANIAGKRASE